MLNNTEHHHTKFSCHGNLASAIHVPLNFCVQSQCFAIYSSDEYTVMQQDMNVTVSLTYIYLDLEWECGDFRLFSFLWLFDALEL